MIYSIRGQLVHLSEHSVVLEDSSGLSWEMEISQHTRRDIASGEGELRQLYTYLYHREDSMSLYGFSRLEEKQFFLLLNRVNGIGPKQSMKILGSAEVSELAAAIVNEDEAFLTSLPGIGAKGAKKIIISLKDSLGNIVSVGEIRPRGEGDAGSRHLGEHLIQALTDMGFERKAAAQAISRVLSSAQSDDEGEILRQAIIELS